VRVEKEDSRRSEHYGEHGTCLQVEEDEEGEEIATVMSERAMFKIAVRCLVQRQAKALEVRALKSFRGTSELSKQLLLMLSGFGWDPEREETVGSVTAKEPKCFESQQVKIWFGLLEWTFEAESVAMYDPDYVQVLTDSANDKIEPELLKGIQDNFKAAFSRAKVHLFPICSWALESVEHWTYLALESETKEVRYYETLDLMKGKNFEMAEKILWIAGFEGVVERVNEVRQEDEECGEALCHYAEQEVRHAAGEGWGSVPAFTKERRREMRLKLGSACGILRKSQEELKEKLRNEELCLQKLQVLKDAALGKTERRLQEIKELKDFQKKLGTEDFFAGSDVQSILPADFAQRVRVKTKSKDPTIFKAEIEKQAAASKKKKEEEEEKAKKKKEEEEEAEKNKKKKPEGDAEKKEKSPKGEGEEKKQAEKEKGQGAKENAGEDEEVSVVEQVVDELDYKVEEVLRKGEQGFEKWLKDLSIEKLEEIVSDATAETKEYLKWIKEKETIKVCSSCRWMHGCETCSYKHALRYVVRHRRPAKWWLRRTGEILRSKAKKVMEELEWQTTEAYF